MQNLHTLLLCHSIFPVMLYIMEQGNNGSQYSGSYKGLLGRVVLLILISVASLGIAVPWAIMLVYRWVASKVKLNDKQVVFSGVGKQLFPAWILAWVIGVGSAAAVAATGWMAFDATVWYEHNAFGWDVVPPLFAIIAVLAVIVVAASFARFYLKMTRILIANTHFEGGEELTSSFGSSFWQFIGKHIVFGLRLVITLGIALPWALDYLLTWFTGETKIDNDSFTYTAAPSFLKKWLPYWAILWVVWIFQDVTDVSNEWGEYGREGSGALNGLFELAELFVQVWVYTVVYRWIFSRISKNDQITKN